MINKTLNLLLLASISAAMTGCKTLKDKVEDQVKNDYEDTQFIPAKSVHFGNLTTTFTPSDQPFVQGTAVRSPQQADDNFTKVAPLSEKSKAKIMQAFTATNQVRAEKGLPPLEYDENLGAYAAVRAQEIAKHFSHTRPDGSRYFSGLTAGSSAENIASGHSSGEETVLEQWKNSAGHYKNMTGNYSRIGIGYILDPKSKDGYYWVQIFGAGQIDSTYRFDASASGPNAIAIGRLLTQTISAKNGKINLGNAPTTDNQAARAYQAKELTHGIYKTARRYDQGGYQAIIQDPTGVFTYQTFGEILNESGIPVQFINIGQPSIPQPNVIFQANYRGASLGAVNAQEHVYADVAANVNFAESKTMNIEFSNSKKIPLTGGNLSSSPDLNFTENLQWQGDHFRGNSVKAQFYGPSGEEIGGSFSRGSSAGLYEGSFGLQKIE